MNPVCIDKRSWTIPQFTISGPVWHAVPCAVNPLGVGYWLHIFEIASWYSVWWAENCNEVVLLGVRWFNAFFDIGVLNGGDSESRTCPHHLYWWLRQILQKLTWLLKIFDGRGPSWTESINLYQWWADQREKTRYLRKRSKEVGEFGDQLPIPILYPTNLPQVAISPRLRQLFLSAKHLVTPQAQYYDLPLDNLNPMIS